MLHASKLEEIIEDYMGGDRQP